MPDQTRRLALVGRDDLTVSQRVNPRDLERMVLERAQDVAATASLAAGLDHTTEAAVRQLCDAVHDMNFFAASNALPPTALHPPGIG